MKWRAWLITALSCLTVTAVLAGIKTSQIAQAMAFMESFPPPVETITIAQARSDRWAPTRLLSGTVRSPEHLVIATEIPGRVVELPFASGDTVPKGAAILVLFNDDLEAQRTRTASRLELSEYPTRTQSNTGGRCLSVPRPTGHADRDKHCPSQHKLP